VIDVALGDPKASLVGNVSITGTPADHEGYRDDLRLCKRGVFIIQRQILANKMVDGDRKLALQDFFSMEHHFDEKRSSEKPLCPNQSIRKEIAINQEFLSNPKIRDQPCSSNLFPILA
jgi:hypothetical protein